MDDTDKKPTKKTWEKGACDDFSRNGDESSTAECLLVCVSVTSPQCFEGFLGGSEGSGSPLTHARASSLSWLLGALHYAHHTHTRTRTRRRRRRRERRGEEGACCCVPPLLRRAAPRERFFLHRRSSVVIIVVAVSPHSPLPKAGVFHPWSTTPRTHGRHPHAPRTTPTHTLPQPATHSPSPPRAERKKEEKEKQSSKIKSRAQAGEGTGL